MENRQKIKLNLLIIINKNKQKAEVARYIIYIRWNIEGVPYRKILFFYCKL